MIKSIEIKNFKIFSDFRFDFDNGLNIIIGENKTGKTTILEAIEFALTGSVKDIKVNSDLFRTFGKIGENKLQVTLETTQGYVERSLLKLGDKCTSSVSFGGESGKKADELIAATFGLSFLTFGFDELLRKNGRERKEIVMKHCNIGAINRKEFQAYVVEKADLTETQTEEVLKPILSKIKADDSDFLDKVIQLVETEFKTLNSATKSEKGGIEKLAGLKAEIDANMNRLPQLEEDSKNLSASILELSNTIAAHEAEKLSMQRDLERKEDDEKNLVSAEEFLHLLELSLSKAEKEQITQLGRKAEIEKEIEDLQQLIDDLESLLKFESLKLNTNFVREEKLHLAALNKSLESLQLEKEDFKVNFTCPVTKNACNANVAKVVESLDEKIAALEDDKTQKLYAIKLAEDKDVITIKTMDEITEKLNQYAVTKSSLFTEFKEISDLIALTERKINDNQIEIKNTVFRIERIEFDLKALAAIEYKTKTVDVDATREMIETLKASKNQKDDQIESIKEKKLMYKRQVEAQKLLEEMQERFDLIVKIKMAIGIHGYQGDFVLTKLDELAEKIDSTIKMIWPDEDFYYEIEEKDFDFGFSGRVFESLSGFEQIVLSLAMTKAMIEQDNYKLLVFDEIGRVLNSSIDGFLNVLNSFKGFQIIVTGAINSNSTSLPCYNINGMAQ